MISSLLFVRIRSDLDFARDDTNVSIIEDIPIATIVS